MPGPLSHIRVLDLSRIMAAPWAGQVLADLGADVIKVERPKVGDDTRGWGPPFVETGGRSDAGYFLCVNRGKRSVTVDMAVPEGRAVLLHLARRTDIVLENFKAGTTARYGLDYDSLKAINPRLIYVSVTGFGQTGPRASQAAYDFMIQAMGGLMSVTGERDGMPGGGPQKVGVPIVDLMTGMYAAVGALAALANRDQTGEGDYVDVAMLDVQAAFLANQAMNGMLTGKAPRRGGNTHPNIQPQDVFACRSGQIALAVGNDGQFAQLCNVLGRPALAAEDRFATNAGRVRNLPELHRIISACLAAENATTWTARLDAVGVPCAPINDVLQMLSDPQIQARQMVRALPYGDGATVPQVVCPLRFTRAELVFDRGPPQLGQHTDEILAALGIDPAAQAELARAGAI
jgi:crotonobetainyl-CoA:carnitine CoA-transferase CaiB-like acyl-CoA transferase